LRAERPSKHLKPHENGVLVEYDNGGYRWHWAATPAEAARRYADVVEATEASGILRMARIKLIAYGQVVAERMLGSQ
jgi:hypothetical protein